MKPILLIAICIVIVALVVIAILFIRHHKMVKSQNTIARAPFNGRHVLVKNWKGADLIPGSGNLDWSFFTSNDPTNSLAQYSMDLDLITTRFSNDSLRIYTSQPTIDQFGLRNFSIRIESNVHFDHGLFIMFLNHIPERPGTWPAWWLNGVTDSQTAWACRGEIDIIEGMNYSENHPNFDKEYRNVSTLHTNTPFSGVECTQNGAVGVSHPTCNASSYRYKTCGCSGKEPCPDLGCSIKAPPNTFGKGFNDVYGKNGGGAFVCELTPDGQVSMWFFDAYGVNNYLTPMSDNTLITEIWPILPYAQFNRCPGQFANMKMIIDTAVCGDWWSDDSCLNLLRQQAHNPPSQNLAYWEISSIAVYQRQD